MKLCFFSGMDAFHWVLNFSRLNILWAVLCCGIIMGTGRKKIEIKMIHDRKKRSVTFSKRRQGLFKKADELCRLTGADISLSVFSPSGKLFTFGCSNSDEVLYRFPVKEEEKEVDGNNSRSENGDGFWWNNLNIDELDTLEKVDAVTEQLLQVQNLVVKRKEELLAALSTSSAAAKETTTSNMEDSCMFSVKQEDDSWFPSLTSGYMNEFDELLKDFYVDQKMQQLPAY
ncbi:agamous-like MADS-box protein AGL29 [Papaver somniferum]|nr:agamous-like MADS-box protein AGL29 [Papaver somniferum]